MSKTLRYCVGGLIAVGLVLFVLGISLPLLSVDKLVVARHTFSLAQAVWALLTSATWPLGIVIALFSLVLPIIKWLWMLSVVLGKAPTLSKKHHALVHFLSRYAMLDVFVVALTFVILQLGWIVRVRLHPGIYFFIAAVICALIAEAIITRKSR